MKITAYHGISIEEFLDVIFYRLGMEKRAHFKVYVEKEKGKT